MVPAQEATMSKFLDIRYYPLFIGGFLLAVFLLLGIVIVAEAVF